MKDSAEILKLLYTCYSKNPNLSPEVRAKVKKVLSSFKVDKKKNEELEWERVANRKK